MIKSEISTKLCHFLSTMEEDLKRANEKSIQRRFVTSIVIRITLGFMLLLAIANIYFLNMLSDGLTNTLDSADVISQEFSNIANDMTAVTSSVEKINFEVNALIPIAKNVSFIDHNMNGITQNLHNITTSMGGIETSINQVDRSMTHVDHTMREVSKDMYFIGEDVNNMSAPAKWMNKMLPW